MLAEHFGVIGDLDGQFPGRRQRKKPGLASSVRIGLWLNRRW